MTVVPIVEGESEVDSVPILLRRLTQEFNEGAWVEVERPIRVRRDQFLKKEEEFRRTLLLARMKAGPDGFVLLLLDADDDCPVELSSKLKSRIEGVMDAGRFRVVFAQREFEAWLIAAAPSLEGHRGFTWRNRNTERCETIRDAKGWLSDQMPGKGYRTVVDQPALTAQMDLQLAGERSRSFQKLRSDWHSILLSMTES